MLRYFPGTEEEPVLKVLGSQDFGGPGGAWDAMLDARCPGMPWDALGCPGMTVTYTM